MMGGQTLYVLLLSASTGIKALLKLAETLLQGRSCSKFLKTGVLVLKKFVIEVPEGYEPLVETLNDAFKQAAFGKGSDRHAGGKPFLDQPIFTIAEEHGFGFLTGQAAKKLGESHTLLDLFNAEKAVQEIFGAIVYSAAAALFLRSHYPNVEPAEEPPVYDRSCVTLFKDSERPI